MPCCVRKNPGWSLGKRVVLATCMALGWLAPSGFVVAQSAVQDIQAPVFDITSDTTLTITGGAGSAVAGWLPNRQTQGIQGDCHPRRGCQPCDREKSQRQRL